MEKDKQKGTLQDGAPCQQSKVATEFLKKNQIGVLEWTGNSPDLNPIENMWTIMKDKQPSSTESQRPAIEGG